jgi:ribosomal protein S18 acetylase RimI-like enzyme
VKPQIRFATTDDLTWCVQTDVHATKEIIQRKIGEQEIIIVETNGQRIGYLRLEYLWSKIPSIALIFILEKYRRQGIGRATLEFLETFLLKNRHRVLLSSSQANEPEPQAWHRAMGFVECGIIAGIYEGGIGEIFFRKQLAG